VSGIFVPMYQKHSILFVFGSHRRMKLKSQKLLTFCLSVCCVIQDGAGKLHCTCVYSNVFGYFTTHSNTFWRRGD